MKTLISIFVVLIALVLFTALFALFKNKGNTVFWLAVRVGLSISLFILIWIAYAFDLIKSSSVY